MSNLVRDIARSIRMHGLHKLASRVLEAEGLPAPKDWTLREVGVTVGTKVAMDRIAHGSVMRGIASLYEVTGSVGEKTAKDGLYHEFSRVKSLRDRLGKTASAETEDGILRYEIGLWQRCKLAAANDPQGVLVGLTRVALSFYDATESAGVKTAASPEEVVNFAASFACASVVDDAIVRMVKAGEVTPREGIRLAELNAQSALNDLRTITREKDANLTDLILPTLGTAAGGAAGGAMGLLSLIGPAESGRFTRADRAMALGLPLGGAALGGLAGYGLNKLRRVIQPEKLPDTEGQTDRNLRTVNGPSGSPLLAMLTAKQRQAAARE